MELKHHLLLFLKFSTSTVWHKLTFLLCPGSLIPKLQPAAFPCGNSAGEEVIPSSLLLGRLFLQFYDRVHCVPRSCWPGTPLHSSLITWTPTQAIRTVSWAVKVSKSVSSSRKVQLIPYSLDNDTPTQIISPLTKWRRIWQILTVTSPSEVGPKVNSPYNHSP